MMKVRLALSFAPEASAWMALERLPTARHGLGAAVLDGPVFVIGGGPAAGLAQTGVVEVYTP